MQWVCQLIIFSVKYNPRIIYAVYRFSNAGLGDLMCNNVTRAPTTYVKVNNIKINEKHFLYYHHWGSLLRTFPSLMQKLVIEYWESWRFIGLDFFQFGCLARIISGAKIPGLIKSYHKDDKITWDLRWMIYCEPSEYCLVFIFSQRRPEKTKSNKTWE